MVLSKTGAAYNDHRCASVTAPPGRECDI